VGDLLARVLPLALGAALSPTMLTVSVLILSSRTRPRTRAVLYTLGVLTIIVALTVLGLTVLDRFADQHPTATERAVSDGVDLALGIVLLALALRTVLRPRDPTQHPKPKKAHDAGGGLLSAFVLGLVVMATNVTTIVLYIPIMKDIGRSSVSDADQLVVVLVVLVIVTLPATLPLALSVIAPDASRGALVHVQDFVQHHQHTIVLVVEAIFGVYLVAKGLGA
jgi:threonine/homoserine/homoserine lactone efflux protein